ncbi:hypothetical protein BDS110ZK14_53150 [Bradyrhizobium diazoefficiens]|nr:hypothetical protein XF15B_24270 [Bradyrhizobium diazoefficiens]
MGSADEGAADRPFRPSPDRIQSGPVLLGKGGGGRPVRDAARKISRIRLPEVVVAESSPRGLDSKIANFESLKTCPGVRSARAAPGRPAEGVSMPGFPTSLERAEDGPGKA